MLGELKERNLHFQKERDMQERAHETGDICIQIADSLSCTAGTNMTLQSNYISMKKKKERKKKKQSWNLIPYHEEK